ncbi:MAG TPA: hypothetical protein VFZ09_21735 [Archangium sp.]|uniref:hypothetical protein n=1 Tax=Archangium sp. TaxID=1872627 RepID=UPI002E35E4E1|nr:hypothetical protein [Archangium sp.]HEX5748877.1 hypothetical protein [Archangium sp.]
MLGNTPRNGVGQAVHNVLFVDDLESFWTTPNGTVQVGLSNPGFENGTVNETQDQSCNYLGGGFCPNGFWRGNMGASATTLRSNRGYFNPNNSWSMQANAWGQNIPSQLAVTFGTYPGLGTTRTTFRGWVHLSSLHPAYKVVAFAVNLATGQRVEEEIIVEEVWGQTNFHTDSLVLAMTPGETPAWDFGKRYLDAVQYFSGDIDSKMEIHGVSSAWMWTHRNVYATHGIPVSIETSFDMNGQLAQIRDPSQRYTVGKDAAWKELERIWKMEGGVYPGTRSHPGLVKFINFDGPFRSLLHPNHGINGQQWGGGFALTEQGYWEATWQVMDYIRTIHSVRPDIRIFVGENFPWWGWGPANDSVPSFGWALNGSSFPGNRGYFGDYQNLLTKLFWQCNNYGARLSGITLDTGYTFTTAANSQGVDYMARVRAVQDWVRGQGYEFNIYVNGDMETSARLTQEHMLLFEDRFKAYGIRPNRHMVASWGKYPLATEINNENVEYDLANSWKKVLQRVKRL